MPRRIHAHDWRATPLGAIERWPQSLRTALDMVLAMPGPATILWGAEHLQLYNDAYIPIAQDRHPALLGRPAAENWPEAYDEVVAPLLAEVAAGRATRLTSLAVNLRNADGKTEERVFDTDWSPIRDETGAIAGTLHTLADITERQRAQESLHASEERQAFLLNLSDALRPLTDAGAIQATTTRMLGEHLGVDRAMYAEVDGEPGAETGLIRGQYVRPTGDGEAPLFPFPQHFTYDVYGAHTMAARYRGEPLVVSDVRANSAFNEAERGAWSAAGVRAAIVATLAKGGRLVAELGLHCLGPRHWTEAEIALVEDVAERTWAAAERARAEAALRESEERQAFLLALGDAMRAERAADAKITVAARLLGEKLDATRVLYAEWDHESGSAHIVTGWLADGAQPFPAVLKLEDFDGEVLNDLREGRVVRIDDVRRLEPQSGYSAIARVGVQALLSLPLLVDGRLELNVSIHQEGPRRWRDDEVALAQEVSQRLWAEIERARAETALRESEQKYRSLFETMGQGYCELELIRDEHGKAVDQLYLELNPAFERLFGIAVADARGRRASEVFPFIDPAWHDAFDEVARTGLYKRFEHQHGASSPWFEVFAYPAGGDRVVVLYDEITDRKRAEQTLRESEERQTFLLKFSDALRAQPDEDSIAAFVLRSMADRLQLDRCYFAEYHLEEDWAGIVHQLGNDRVPTFPPVIRLSDFPQALQTAIGRTLTVENVGDAEFLSDADRRNMRALGMGAFITAAVRRGEDIPLFTIVGVSAAPRGWTNGEIRLVEEVNERAWAAIERTRGEAALRESEEQLRAFGEASSDVLWIRNAGTLQWEYLSPAYETIYGMSVEEALAGETFGKWTDLIVDEDRRRAVADIHRVIAGERLTFEYRIRRADGELRWLRNTDFPMRGADGKVERIGGVGQDVTELKRIEAALRDEEKRLRVLLEGIPQLVWRSCDQGMWTWSSRQWQHFIGQSLQESLGLGWMDVVHPDDHLVTLEAWDEAKPHGLLDVEYRVRRTADGKWLWHHTRSVPLHDEQGRIVEWLGTSTDIHALRELQERQKVLVAELQHRTRNLLGVVRSMSDKTARASADLPDFRERFRERLEALGRVQGLLSRLNEHDRVTFDDLVATELAAMDGNSDKVTLDGPTGVRLRSSTVQTLAMALHELATNAVKYGALGQPAGRLYISWALTSPDADGTPRLHIDWRERGVTMPSPSATRGSGQGRELIERALPYQLSAETSYVLGPDGVHCTITIPVSASIPEADDERT